MKHEVRRWRRWTWFLIAWSALALVLAVLAATVLGDACAGMEGIGLGVCEAGTAVGTIIALLLVFLIWLIGFLLLSIGWFARRPARRLCPPYGHPVDRGLTRCPECDYDFAPGAEAAT